MVGAFGLSPVVPVDCQPMSLSTILRNRINELEMSISDLARRSGVSRATVIRILGGKDEHYSVSNLQAVLSALGMKMDLLAIPAAVVCDSPRLADTEEMHLRSRGRLLFPC